jgi:nicotinate-nucleotide adenylyltransferase
MVKLAVEDREGLEGSDIEIKRGGTSFTIDTVRKLSWDIGTDIELFLLMGTDAARGVPHWRGVPEIFKYVRPIVLERTGDDPIDWDVLARQLPAGLADEFRASIVSLTRPTKISSTEIRRRLGDGSAVSGIVPKAVEDYIHQYGLYGARLGKRRKD